MSNKRESKLEASKFEDRRMNYSPSQDKTSWLALRL